MASGDIALEGFVRKGTTGDGKRKEPGVVARAEYLFQGTNIRAALDRRKTLPADEYIQAVR